MSRLSPRLPAILLAACSTACGTASGPAIPDPPPAASTPTRWTGTATFQDETQYENGESKDRFELEVTWVKVENPSPAPPAGTTRYAPSGRVRASIQRYVDLGGTCTIDRQAEFPIAVTDEQHSPDQQSLDLGSDGQYHGKLYGGWLLEYVQFCPDRAFAQRSIVRVALDIRGTLDGGRMHGSMQPYVVTIPSSLTSTSTGSWSFAAN